MRKYLILFFFFITSCYQSGDFKKYKTGIINGKKVDVYLYYYDFDKSVKLAFINDTINSTTYKNEKKEETTIIINELNKPTTITINGEILMENDSMILIKKNNYE